MTLTRPGPDEVAVGVGLVHGEVADVVVGPVSGEVLSAVVPLPDPRPSW